MIEAHKVRLLDHHTIPEELERDIDRMLERPWGSDEDYRQFYMDAGMTVAVDPAQVVKAYRLAGWRVEIKNIAISGGVDLLFHRPSGKNPEAE